MEDLVNPEVSVPKSLSGKPQVFQCKACGGSVSVKAVGVSISAVCSHCGSLIDITDENFNIIKEAHQKIRKTLLEIGARGTLKGIEWEVIGYVEKTDGSGEYFWEEYLLFNPYYGFRFLVQADGHWSFVKVLREDIEGIGSYPNVNYNGDVYRLFLKGTSVVKYVKGEFYWRVKVGERSGVADYIAPPYMLSYEATGNEINISLGEYVDAQIVFNAFKIEGVRPFKKGVAPHQPSPHIEKRRRGWKSCLKALACCVVVQILTFAFYDNALILSEKIPVSNLTGSSEYISQPFEFKAQADLVLQSYANVSNEWIELDFSLINQKDFSEISFLQTIEYYYGTDGGEYWSEGKKNPLNYVSAVPAGTYRLQVNGTCGLAFYSQNHLCNVKEAAFSVWKEVPDIYNLFIVLGFLVLIPIYLTYRAHIFEVRRWAESDYAPPIYRKES